MSRRLPLALVALFCCAALGCARSGPRRFAVGGQVTLDGAPLPEGEILFRPGASTSGPTAAGLIEEGRYSIDEAHGPVSGSYAVVITASRKTGRKVQSEMRGTATTDQYEQYLPARYNDRTELSAQVDDDRDDLNFQLTTARRMSGDPLSDSACREPWRRWRKCDLASR